MSLLGRELSRRDVSKPPHFDLARRINITLYCFNLRSIDFPMPTLYRGTFIIRQAYSMIYQSTTGPDLLIPHSDHMTAEQLFSSPAQIISLSSAVVVCAATQFLTLFATKRTTAQNRVAFRDVCDSEKGKKQMHLMAGQVIISI